MFDNKKRDQKIIDSLKANPPGGWDGVNPSSDPAYRQPTVELEKAIHHQNDRSKTVMARCTECGKQFPSLGGKKQCSLICESNAAFNQARQSQADRASLTLDDYEHNRHLPTWDEVRFRGFKN